VWHTGGKRCRALNVKHEGKRLLGGHRHRWWNNIKMDLKGIVWMAGLDSSGSG
jgi:hypothetical protein